MRKLYLVMIVVLLFVSCAKKIDPPKEWALLNSVTLKGINPIGLAVMNGELWLSDGDHNRLVQINPKGEILKEIDSLERPMHIDADKEILYVPQYGMDNIAIFNGDKRGILDVQDSLDAPAGVSVYKSEWAIADFYNNRILYNNGKNQISFGKEGRGNGEFYYPTDVQITENEIWVADAYNNRVQVFDKKGNFLKIIGAEEKMNAATGIYVSADELFVTDFENDRVLIFNLKGELKQVLKEEIEKPTDILKEGDTLFIINYRSGKLNTYDLQPVSN